MNKLLLIVDDSAEQPKFIQRIEIYGDELFSRVDFVKNIEINNYPDFSHYSYMLIHGNYPKATQICNVAEKQYNLKTAIFGGAPTNLNTRYFYRNAVYQNLMEVIRNYEKQLTFDLSAELDWEILAFGKLKKIERLYTLRENIHLDLIESKGNEIVEADSFSIEDYKEILELIGYDSDKINERTSDIKLTKKILIEQIDSLIKFYNYHE